MTFIAAIGVVCVASVLVSLFAFLTWRRELARRALLAALASMALGVTLSGAAVWPAIFLFALCVFGAAALVSVELRQHQHKSSPSSSATHG